MSERNVLKTQLAGEVATVVYGDDDVPSASWERLDAFIEEVFGEAPTGRLRTLVDDAGQVNACARLDTSAIAAFKGSADDDWESLRGVIEHAINELDPRRAVDDEDDSGAEVLELVIHGRR
jgi:hypothetical protein